MLNDNVKSLPTEANGDQGWRCTVCGRSFSYSQPIEWGLQLALLRAFGEAHLHDAVQVKQPASLLPYPLADVLAHAQQCSQDAPFLDAGRIEHAQLAADVQQLVHLVADIRAMATGSVPNCINLAGIDRLISTIKNA